jgi:GntR family transcriptional regulator
MAAAYFARLRPHERASKRARPTYNAVPVARQRRGGPERRRDTPQNPDGSVGPLAAIRLETPHDAPLHAQLTAAVRGQIRDGQLPVGAALPSELELAAALGISRHTVRHALGVLVNEGWLRRQRGAKTVVASRQADDQVIERRLGSFYAFAWEIEARGEHHRSKILARDKVTADARLAHLLAVELGTPMERIERLRSADGEPLTLEVSILPAALSAVLDDAALEQQSIYDVLEVRHGITVVRASETLRPVVLDRRAADLLGVATGSPAFSVERVSWSQQGPVEWEHSLIRGDRYLYSVELPRSFSRPIA